MSIKTAVCVIGLMASVALVPVSLAFEAADTIRDSDQASKLLSEVKTQAIQLKEDDGRVGLSLQRVPTANLHEQHKTNASPEVLRERPIRIDVQRVLMNVTAIDDRDHLVTGLGREDFQLREDGRTQGILDFFEEETPISLAIVFDASSSMADKMDRSRVTVRQLLRITNQADEFLLISFDDHAASMVDFPRDVRIVQDKVNSTQAKGSTALFDLE